MATSNKKLSMNARGKGSKRSKLPENLASITTLTDENTIIHSNVNSLILEEVLNADTLDEQIQGIRKLILLLTSTEAEISCTPENSESFKRAADIVTMWFFKLPSNSCLKPVIASAINKAEESGDHGKKLFVSSFYAYVSNIISKAENYKAIEDDSKLINYSVLINAETLRNFLSCVTRCLENNCKVPISVLQTIRANVMRTFEKQFYAPLINYMTIQGYDHSIHERQLVIEVTSTVIRITFILELHLGFSTKCVGVRKVREIVHIKCLFTNIA